MPVKILFQRDRFVQQFFFVRHPTALFAHELRILDDGGVFVEFGRYFILLPPAHRFRFFFCHFVLPCKVGLRGLVVCRKVLKPLYEEKP